MRRLHEGSSDPPAMTTMMVSACLPLRRTIAVGCRGPLLGAASYRTAQLQACGAVMRSCELVRRSIWQVGFHTSICVCCLGAEAVAAQPGIQMDLKDLVDMGKADLGDLPEGADAVPLLPDGSVRRWPTANENHTTVTQGEVHFLPAVASDFDPSTELGEAARTKFQLSVAASLGITPECIRITDVRDVSFLEAVQELARREEHEQLLDGLDEPEEAEEELYELQMKHGKARFKQAVKKWRKRDHSNGDLKTSQVRRRKEKLERLLDDLEQEHNGA
eukprot:COSAG02_NODE_1553_length_11961_cov_5.094335_2_plen_276_part_00